MRSHTMLTLWKRKPPMLTSDDIRARDSQLQDVTDTHRDEQRRLALAAEEGDHDARTRIEALDVAIAEAKRERRRLQATLPAALKRERDLATEEYARDLGDFTGQCEHAKHVAEDLVERIIDRLPSEEEVRAAVAAGASASALAGAIRAHLPDD